MTLQAIIPGGGGSGEPGEQGVSFMPSDPRYTVLSHFYSLDADMKKLDDIYSRVQNAGQLTKDEAILTLDVWMKSIFAYASAKSLYENDEDLQKFIYASYADGTKVNVAEAWEDNLKVMDGRFRWLFAGGGSLVAPSLSVNQAMQDWFTKQASDWQYTLSKLQENRAKAEAARIQLINAGNLTEAQKLLDAIRAIDELYAALWPMYTKLQEISDGLERNSMQGLGSSLKGIATWKVFVGLIIGALLILSGAFVIGFAIALGSALLLTVGTGIVLTGLAITGLALAARYGPILADLAGATAEAVGSAVNKIVVGAIKGLTGFGDDDSSPLNKAVGFGLLALASVFGGMWLLNKAKAMR